MTKTGNSQVRKEPSVDGSSGTAASQGWRDQPGMEHLRDDAPYRVCSGCGRHSWGERFGDRCGMQQPDGSFCNGTLGDLREVAQVATAREQTIMRALLDLFQPLGSALGEGGWQPELVVLAPSELPRISGYKVALVVPVETAKALRGTHDDHGAEAA